MRRITLVAALLLGCAHAPSPTAETPTPAASPPRLPASHGQQGAEVPIALPHTVADGKSGAPLSDDALDRQLRAAKVIYVGEEHPNPHHHAVELEVLARAYAVDPSLGLGLEMLPRALQPELDGYLAGTLDEAAFLKAVDWAHTWGYAWGFYKPLLEFCRAHRLPAYALNAPKALAHAVAFHGLASLSPDERKALPELQPGPAAHRELVREAFAQHPHGAFGDAAFERFYAAQLVWDETMAERVATVLAAPGAPARLVVVAGNGHTRRFAVPDRAARRGARPYLTVRPVLDDERDDAVADQVADVLWVLQPGETATRSRP